MKALLRIINTHFWKSYFGPFFAFIFPLIFVFLLGFILGYDQFLGGSFAIPSTSVAMVIVPAVVYEFRNSSLLKRIGVTKIKNSTFIGILVLYYFIIMLIATIFTLLISIAVFGGMYWETGRTISKIIESGVEVKLLAPNFKTVLETVNWFGLTYGVFLNIIIGVVLGMTISTLANSSVAIQGIGTFVMVISQLLTAQSLPLSLIAEQDIFRFLGYVSPFKYTTSMIIESWIGNFDGVTEPIDKVINLTFLGGSNFTSGIFDLKTNFNVARGVDSLIGLQTEEKIANIVVPYLIIILLTGISLRRFKWSTRG